MEKDIPMKSEVLVDNIKGWSVVKLGECIHAEHMTCKKRIRPREAFEYSWELEDGTMHRYDNPKSRIRERCYRCDGVVPDGVVALVKFANWERV